MGNRDRDRTEIRHWVSTARAAREIAADLEWADFRDSTEEQINLARGLRYLLRQYAVAMFRDRRPATTAAR